MGINRREFIRSTAAAGAGLIFSPMVLGETGTGAVAKSDDINVAIIGVGDQGRILLEAAVKIPGLKFKAVCDIWTEFNQKNASNFLKAYKHEHNVYTDYQRDVRQGKGFAGGHYRDA